mmetsp:Transcript_18889/g.49637  ORF Transcript_18889/g.49637 Transcript_18889/m.49637 type:complete len:308 (+) Transcript_18889:214-1137(+)
MLTQRRIDFVRGPGPADRSRVPHRDPPGVGRDCGRREQNGDCSARSREVFNAGGQLELPQHRGGAAAADALGHLSQQRRRRLLPGQRRQPRQGDPGGGRPVLGVRPRAAVAVRRAVAADARGAVWRGRARGRGVVRRHLSARAHQDAHRRGRLWAVRLDLAVHAAHGGERGRRRALQGAADRADRDRALLGDRPGAVRDVQGRAAPAARRAGRLVPRRRAAAAAAQGGRHAALRRGRVPRRAARHLSARAGEDAAAGVGHVGPGALQRPPRRAGPRVGRRWLRRPLSRLWAQPAQGAAVDEHHLLRL